MQGRWVVIPDFQYKAINISGEIIEGVFEARTRRDVQEMIRQKAFFPLEIKEHKYKKDIKDLFVISKVSSREISIFCNQFSTIIKAGIPVAQCLYILIEQTTNTTLRKGLESIYEGVQKGESLSEGMRKYGEPFPSILINMIEAGEVSGTLDTSLERMSEHFEKEYKLKQKVKNALSYPSVVLITTIGIIYFLMTKIVPTFIGIFESSNASLPLATRLLLAISNYLANSGIIITLFISLMFIILKIVVSKGFGRYLFHKTILKLPFIGKLQTQIISAKFTRTMSTLITSGVSLTNALEITAKITGNSVAEQGILKAEEQVKQGKGLNRPLSTLKLFPPIVIHMISIGEESGSLDEMLKKTAEFYEAEVDNSIQKMTAMFEPIIIVILGGIIGFIVISIALPMFEVVQLVG